VKRTKGRKGEQTGEELEVEQSKVGLLLFFLHGLQVTFSLKHEPFRVLALWRA
jgi:hypothetical protein